MAHLQLSSAGHQQRLVDRVIVIITSVFSLDFCWGRETNVGEHKCACLFVFLKQHIPLCKGQVIVVTCSPPFESISNFKLMDIHDSLFTEQPVGRRAEMQQWRRKQQDSGCAFGPQRVGTETNEEEECSSSLLKAQSKSRWLTWRTHDASISHTHICTLIHNYLCVYPGTQLFFICFTQTHTCAQNKAVCLLFTGCGNRFASMCSLSHERRDYRQRCSTVQQRDLASMENQQRKISTHADVALVHVHIFAERLHHLKNQNNQHRSKQKEGEHMWNLKMRVCFIFCTFARFTSS